MGLIWDLIQHGQIRDAKDRTASIEERVAALEDDLRATNEALQRILEVLERRLGEDLDGDGRLG